MSDQMDSRLYNAAISGDMNVVVQEIDKVGVRVTINNDTVLHLASKSGKIECVQTILSKHPELLCWVNFRGDTALHLAARNGHLDVVKALITFARPLEKGLESGVGAEKEMLRMTNEEKDTALHEAVRYKHLNVVTLLTQADCEFPHSANNDKETPLYIAAKRGYDDFVSIILRNCTSPAYGGPVGRTALHGAIMSNSEGIVEKLLVQNPSLIKEIDVYGRTPLHYAAFFGYDSNVSKLLEANTCVAYFADRDDKNTALHLAASQGHKSVMETIISKCPDCLVMVNGRGRNILHIAVEYERKGIITFILDSSTMSDSLINQKDNDGNTPLHLLAASNCSVPELVQHSMANMRTLNKANLSPLDIVRATTKSLSSSFEGFSPENVTLSATKSVSSGFEGFSPENVTLSDGHVVDELKSALSLRDKAEIVSKNQKKERFESLKKAADTQVIVATLVATVAFTAGFTIPGGYNGIEGPNQGMAILSREAAFKAFIITDTLALLFSIIAITIYSFVPIFERMELENEVGGARRGTLNAVDRLRTLNAVERFGTRNAGDRLLNAVDRLLNAAESYRYTNSANILIFGKNAAEWYRFAIATVILAISAMMLAFVTGIYAVLPHSPALTIAICVVGCYCICVIATIADVFVNVFVKRK